MIKKIPKCNVDAGLLVLRIGVGLIFVVSGWMKVSNLSMTMGYFAQMGFSAFWVYLVSLVELVGGVAVLLGTYTRFFSGLLAIVMLVAIYVVGANMAVMTPVAVFFSCLALTLSSGGKYSVKHSKHS